MESKIKTTGSAIYKKWKGGVLEKRSRYARILLMTLLSAGSVTSGECKECGGYSFIPGEFEKISKQRAMKRMQFHLWFLTLSGMACSLIFLK